MYHRTYAQGRLHPMAPLAALAAVFRKRGDTRAARTFSGDYALSDRGFWEVVKSRSQIPQ